MGQNEQAAVLRAHKAPVQAADLGDFEPLVRAHQPRIYRVLLGMLRDPDAAETLSQECFLKAYQNRASFRGEASVGAWLLKIAVNLTRDHRRSRLRQFWQKLFSTSEDVDGIAERLPDSHASPERMLLAQEEVATVWSTVERLSPQQRAVFVLRFVEEMSLKEIAEATALKVGTVQIHLFRAVSSVRQRLRKRKNT